MRIALGALLVACGSSGTAHAGRSFFGWLEGTEVLPERGVELQTWVYEENEKYGTDAKDTWLWWGPVVGITDRLELQLPIEAEWSQEADGTTRFSVRRFGAGLRYRLVSADPVEAPPLVPLVQASVKRDVRERDDVHIEAGGSLSYEAGAVQALAAVGYVGDFESNTSHSELRPGAGVSVAVTSELRLGAELYAELSFDNYSESWASAGPDIAWTHGRFWISGVFGIGVYHVQTAPRVMWGIAF
ncbi:MAG TPA: hypothetical protein VGC42_17665 [Kofleriaceae bacterium]